MIDEPDDNPFARNSAWPKMPQAPFRVGPMPKAEVQKPPSPTPTRNITPLFVRPIETAPAPRLDIGGGVPRALPGPTGQQVAAVPEPDTKPLPPTFAGSVIRNPDPEEPFEVSPVIIMPHRKPRTRPRRSVWPAAIATMVGVAGTLGLAMLLSRVQEARLASKPASAVIAPASAPAPAPLAPILQVATKPEVAPLPSISTPRTSPGFATPARVQPAPRVKPATESAVATNEALNAPALSLPGAPPPPNYKAPPEVDPTAPVVTRAPNS
jgi:hypothetical protein